MFAKKSQEKLKPKKMVSKQSISTATLSLNTSTTSATSIPSKGNKSPCRLDPSRELDQLRSTLQHERAAAHELRAALDEERSALHEQRRAACNAELTVTRMLREAEMLVAKAESRQAKAEAERDMAREEVEKLKETLDIDKHATISLLREHTAEIKQLKEQVRAEKCQAYRELHDRSVREEETNRMVRMQAEQTFKILEEDFKAALADKDEELRVLRNEMKERQKEMESQLRSAVRCGLTQSYADNSPRVQTLKAELATSKQTCQKLQDELQDAKATIMRLKGGQRRMASTGDVSVTKGETRDTGNRKRQANLGPNGDLNQMNDSPKKKPKAQTKMTANDNRCHVKNIVRQLQAKSATKLLNDNNCNNRNNSPSKPASRTIEDLKAIDADIERLREQLEERDRVIMLLREETTIKQRQGECMEMCSSPDVSGSSSSDSDGPSPTPSDEVNFDDVLTRHLQKKALERVNDNEAGGRCMCGAGGSLAREIQRLRDHETALLAEAATLREQNDLMEFRILELEENSNHETMEHKRSWCDRADVSDSGVTSLPSLCTSDELTSDEDNQHNTSCRPKRECKVTGVATVFPSVRDALEVEKTVEGKLGATDALQESGIFDEEDIPPFTNNKTTQTVILPNEKYPTQVRDLTSFYEERLLQLQKKLEIYESSGKTQEKLLKRRLERETSLETEVRTLKDRVCDLETRNRVLEEERCEFEEAENDSRFECQRLELEMMELSVAKAQLEEQVEEQQQLMTSQGNLRGRRDVTEQIASLQQQIDELTSNAQHDKAKIEELEAQLEEKDEKMDAILQMKLSTSAADAQAISQQLGLPGLSDVSRPSEPDQHGDTEAMKERIETLEKTNEAFIKALSDCDQYWAITEEDYKTKLRVMEEKHAAQMSMANLEVDALRAEVSVVTQELENTRDRLNKMDDLEISNRALKTQMEMLVDEANGMKNQIQLMDSDFIMYNMRIERLTRELETYREEEDPTLRLKLTELAAELSRKNKEISDLEVTTSELREEVETLEESKSEITNESSNSLTTLNALIKKQSSLKISPSADLHELRSAASRCEPTAAFFSPVTKRTQLNYAYDDLGCALSLNVSHSKNESPNLVGIPNSKDLATNCNSSYPSETTFTSDTHHDVPSKPMHESAATIDDPSNVTLGNDMFIADRAGNAGANLPILGVISAEESTQSTHSICNDPLSGPVATPRRVAKARVMSRRPLQVSSSEATDTSTINLQKFKKRNTPRGRARVMDPDGLKTVYRAVPGNTSDEGLQSTDTIYPDTSRSTTTAPTSLTSVESGGGGDRLRRINPNVTDAPTFPVRDVRRMGRNSLLVTWDVYRAPEPIIGYEVTVNNQLWKRVQEARNTRALLTNLVLNSRVVICVHPVTLNGRTDATATAVYPPIYP